MINCIFVSSTSACFEWQNDCAYYCEKEYTVLINGRERFHGNTNVFSLFDLEPNTEYNLSIKDSDEHLSFKTSNETVAISVKDFGAVGDGVTDDSIACQSAVNCLPKGGRLYFPSGTYVVSPINLKSHITIELAEGATILGIADKTGYPKLPGEIYDIKNGESVHIGTWEGNAVPMHQALIFSEYAEDITIVGRGVIDGNARAAGWWEDIYNFEYARPRLMFFNRCDNVHIHGITVKNSASWHLHPYFSSNIDFLDVKVQAPDDSPNTDAIDPEACDRVDIIGCRLSVGDDCIAIKSGKIDLGRKYKKPANRHTVRNCYMERGHGAVTLGSEISGGVTNLTVSKCVFKETDRGLRIKTRRGRGKDCIIDGVTFENIQMSGVGTPIVINMYYNCCDPDRESEYVWSREALPVDDRTPYLGNFVFRNMNCERCQIAALFCDGLPEMPIKSVTLDNISFDFAEDAKPGLPAMQSFLEPKCRMGMYAKNIGTLTLKNVNITGHMGDELITENVKEIK